MTKTVCVTDLACGVAAHQYDDGDVVLELPSSMDARFFTLSRSEILRIASLSRKQGSCAAVASPKTQGKRAGAQRAKAQDRPEMRSSIVLGDEERAGQYVSYMRRRDDGRYAVIVEGLGMRSDRVYKDYDSARRAKTCDTVGTRGRVS